MVKPRLISALRTAGGFVWNAARWQFVLSLSAEALGAVALAAVLLFGRNLVTELTGNPPVDELRDVLPETAGLALALIVSGVTAAVVRQARMLVVEQVTRHVQEEIIEVSTSVDYELYEQQQFNDDLQRANIQAAQNSYQIVYDVLNLFNLAVTSLVIVVVLVRSVPEVLGVLLLIAVPSVIAARASAALAFRTTWELTTSDRLRGYLYQALTSKPEAKELRVFGLSPLLKGRWDRLYDERIGRIRSLVKRQTLLHGLAALIGALLVSAVLLVLVDAAIDGRVTLGDAAVAIVALQQLTSRLRSAANASGSLRQATLYLDDFDRFRDMRSSEANERGTAASARVQGRVVVDHVSFRYPGTDIDVLDDVSLELAPGEIVALVGLSGSGKTTLAHLVAGLYRPTKGSILVDDTDTATIPPEQYWRSVAVVFQDFVRYQLSARENVAMSDPDRIDDLHAVNDAAERAGIDQVLRRLPAGYETFLSRAYDSGMDLSIGEWQRVAVARAFFRDTPLLILDEPAAALDAVAEQRLYERLEELCRDRSVLLISHRFSTVRMADRICFLEHGRIIEEGTHAQLMALGGRYCEMFTLQAKGYLPDAFASDPVSDGHA